MKPRKSQINKLKLYLLSVGAGAKIELAKQTGCAPSEITRLLNGDGISEEKWDKIGAKMQPTTAKRLRKKNIKNVLNHDNRTVKGHS